MAKLRVLRKIHGKRKADEILNIPINLPTLTANEQFIIEISSNTITTEQLAITEPIDPRKPEDSRRNAMARREKQLTGNKSIRTILILAVYSDDLPLDREIKKIKEVIQLEDKGNYFKVKNDFVSHPSQVLDFLQKEKPYIVHFCGHGSTQGLVFKKDDGHIPIEPKVLADVFKEFSKHISCLILNACYSGKAAEEISKCIKYVIGINQEVKDGASIAFSQGFYTTLCSSYQNQENRQGHDEDIFETAFRRGNLQTRMSGFQDTQFCLFREISTKISESSETKAMSLDYLV